jgi:hypothetical protein
MITETSDDWESSLMTTGGGLGTTSVTTPVMTRSRIHYDFGEEGEESFARVMGQYPLYEQ